LRKSHSDGIESWLGNNLIVMSAYISQMSTITKLVLSLVICNAFPKSRPFLWSICLPLFHKYLGNQSVYSVIDAVVGC